MKILTSIECLGKHYAISYVISHIKKQFHLSVASRSSCAEKFLARPLLQIRLLCIVIDSIIDISHSDQLSFSVRYVDINFVIQERFQKFTNIESSMSANLFQTLTAILEEVNYNINYIWSQSYDVASNMSGHLSGLQTRVKEVNDMTHYVDCCAHKLNLVLAVTCLHEI